MPRSLPARYATAASIALLVAACAGAHPSASPSDAAPTAGPSGTAAAASPSAPPAATAPPPDASRPTAAPIGENYLAGLRYSCGEAEFPIEILDAPQHAELSDDPPAAELTDITQLMDVDGWWLIDRTETSAEYVGFGGDFGLVYARADIFEGAWRAVHFGDCHAVAVIPDATVVSWWIRKADWPAAQDRTLHLTVQDGCPKTVADRMLDPVVRSSADALVVLLPTEEVAQTSCGMPEPDDQLSRITIQLDEPVGNRALYDGESWPLRDAHQRPEPIHWCCG